MASNGPRNIHQPDGFPLGMDILYIAGQMATDSPTGNTCIIDEDGHRTFMKNTLKGGTNGVQA